MLCKYQWTKCSSEKINVGWFGKIKHKSRKLLYASYKRLTAELNTQRVKVKAWKIIFHANRYDNKAGVVKFMSDKIEFKTKTVRQDRRDHFLYYYPYIIM